MDEALDLADYLPVSFKTPSEQEYISFPMSRKDIKLCINLDISAVEDDNREAIEALHNTLCEAYGPA